MLVRKWLPYDDCSVNDPVFQVVIPTKFRDVVLETAHGDVAGHMGVKKTCDRLLHYFFWPGLMKEVTRFIKTCHTCQITGKPNQIIKPAPIYPIPAESEPFQHLITDCVGPLPPSKSGCTYLLTVMCQTTRYPAVYPLQSITTQCIVKALTQFISILTSQMFAQVLRQLRVKHNKANAYHAQS